MNRNDLRKIDFNLLIVFETLMQEHNLTRTGEKLFIGQSAISASLNRLRHFFDDPLFVRMGRKMEPTSRAVEIHLSLTPALDSIASALSKINAFDPMTSDSVFRIGLSDDVEYSLLPGLIRQLRTEAPHVSFVIRRTDHSLLADQLSSAEVSLGICHSRDLPANAKRKFLRTIRPTVLSSDASSGSLDLDEYCDRPHVSVSLNGEVVDSIDRALMALGRQRQVVLAVPQYSALKTLIEDTQMVAVVPDYVAKTMIRQGGLRMDALPLSIPALDLSMSWGATSDTDPGERWLRSRISNHLCEKGAAIGHPVSVKEAA
ncbi:LysR family transcriptional regulator [Pseudomonas gregormendelii]|uniref:LysR family transcriptional regulator n=1 Tax=Pseudomonas gregormendelii TaxID=1628277 RepID=A0ABS3AHB9_9PSED|nr:LysR family transcriptional regulator [Pseudomonas gregormendelii]MBN3965716.1 LysR family transcriptional regulator [Pseudomonas gregormendelii]